MTWQTAYQSAQGCVSWQGEHACEGDELNGFLQGPVAVRLNDTEGGEAFNKYLRGLSLTGMGQGALEEVLAAEVPETRDWAAGEALAEAVLEAHHDVVLPWNTERDKRNPFASLPGADIVGFQRDGGSHRLALGEVKCSSEAKSPPQVMSGRSGGLTHQIDNLASNLGTICQLLKWLLPRVKHTAHEPAFNTACTRFFNSDLRDLALFGILVRDQEARESDLQARGQQLADRLQAPASCLLIALYLPWPIAQLPQAISQGGAA
ncbi:MULTISPECIES: hypothetical protein [Acidithiobacillus]|jgi:hypothetical protein|uniref:DUF1837 domain-containing protein n=2 Tax=Acidithiobacillus ferrooxidans TaxID=920 RepID=B7J6E1_ACIF2|nr:MULTISPECIES: hypothetical protein [Acidithiobacillus]EGQ63044.1 hypothetical protein GGI1_16689 [Acidithiobacillus sp. GGI-221]MCL5957552.1 hypothetical protein [Gammaproteobacteria bacterium]ACH84225.1 conserved hypothetical protein [Acidithiobacillus ferrooxidans ATCC 53993]ACK78202.1 hypothetical protein AFE_2377 [Acidithiobacillus ferrooxidans ATCC 23270]MBN6745270.1 hypothetical protein [Acidithiobacillus sp. MC2.2]